MADRPICSAWRSGTKQDLDRLAAVFVGPVVVLALAAAFVPPCHERAYRVLSLLLRRTESPQPSPGTADEHEAAD